VRHWSPALVALLATLVFADLDLPIQRPVPPEWKITDEKPGQRPEPPPATSPIPEVEDYPVFFGETVGLGKGSLVYVLDFSQSMGVFGERIDYRTVLSRWDVVAREARRSISSLSPSIMFDLVVFGTNGGCGVTVWRQTPLIANDANKASALAWLGQFTNAVLYGGATPTGPAVVEALALQPEVIVLLTDGVPSPCGLAGWPVRTHQALIKRKNEGTRIDVFGIGLPTEHADLFCRGVASSNGGTFVELR